MKRALLAFILGLTLVSVNAQVDVGSILLDESNDVLFERIPIQTESFPLGLTQELAADFAQIINPPVLKANLTHQLDKAIITHPQALQQVDKLFGPASLSFSHNLATTVSQWRVSVIGYEGDVIAQWDGAGRLPDTIEWNAHQDGWVRIKPGQPYVLSLYAAGQNGEGAPLAQSDPLVLNAFEVQIDQKLIMFLSSKILFDGANEAHLSKQGSNWMMAVCQNVARWPGKPIQLQVLAKDHEAGRQKGDAVLDFMAQVLLLNRNDILYDVQVEPLDSEEIRISILGLDL